MKIDVGDITKEFQEKIHEQYKSLDLKDQFTFLVDLNTYLTKIVNDLIGGSYVEIAKELKEEELRIDSVHKYVAKIIQVLVEDDRPPANMEQATNDLFELVDEIEKERLKRTDFSDKDEKELAFEYLSNLKTYIGD